MNVTLEVTGNCVFGPTPLAERRRIELQPTTRSRKTAFDLAGDTNTHQSPSILVAVRKRQRNNVWPSRFCCASKNSSKTIFAQVFEFLTTYSLIVNFSDLLFNFKRAI